MNPAEANETNLSQRIESAQAALKTKGAAARHAADKSNIAGIEQRFGELQNRLDAAALNAKGNPALAAKILTLIEAELESIQPDAP